jgi:hypothetical protein
MSKSKGEEIGVDKLEWDKQHLLQGRSELRAGSGGGGSLNIPVESIPGFFTWLFHLGYASGAPLCSKTFFRYVPGSLSYNLIDVGWLVLTSCDTHDPQHQSTSCASISTGV